MSKKSLLARNNDLANTERQLEILSNGIFANGELPTFAKKIKETNQFPLRPKKLEILQINLGYMCNQVCAHCHVDAGPDRKEIMTVETMKQCLEVIEKYYDLPEFFKKYNVHVVSSMPHWTRGKTDKQRGNGVFDKSIKALQELNAVGYGMPDSSLKLDLVYNPSGAYLPGDQMALEQDFKKALKDDFNIEFNSLFAITNLPISRFLDYLIASENYEDYMFALVEAYNPAAVQSVMCTNTISVSWDGWLYDCDFNQMLNLKVNSKIKHISKYNEEVLQDRNIIINQHCYGCTAGAGSSCQGVVA